ncbi:MAG: hypothetical protein Q4C73_03050 [Eubacteriales bacterium]|nr:hypothetical protein [Eubacteriales bacterium]
MAKKERKPMTCTIEMTEGAEQRIVDALVDLYYAIKDGKVKGPTFPNWEKKKDNDEEPV